MKVISRILALALFLTVADSTRAVVGYVNHPMQIGYNLFCSPLIPAGGVETLSVILPSVPDGTMVSLWNPGTLAFDTSSTFAAGAWSLDLSLPRGTGARLTASVAFTATFVGEVGSRDGNPFYPDPPFPYPPPFSGPNGIYLLGDKIPVGGGDVFMRVIGRSPIEGEQVITEDGSIFTFSAFSSTGWLGSLNQEVSEPTLAPSYSAFFNIGPVPEPSAVTLCLLGLGLLAARRRN